jgi:hypothetical protein
MKNVMIFAIILFELTPGFGQDRRTKAAEGGFSYISVGTVGEVRGHFDEWMLWKTARGYELETTVHMQGQPQQSLAQETLYLSDVFHIDGFKMPPFASDPPVVGFYECHLQPVEETQRLHCDYSMHNKQGGGSIALPQPYLFEVSIKPVEENAVFDLPFLFANIAGTATRDPNQSSTVPLAYLKVRNAEDGNPNHVTVVADRTEDKKVRFVGRQQIRILRKDIEALKFELNDQFSVWTAENGMPLVIEHMKYPRRWELTRFRQYEKLVPGLE